MKPTHAVVSDMRGKGYAPEKVERVREILEKVDRTLEVEQPWPFNQPMDGGRYD